MSEFDTRRVDALAAAEIGEYPAVKAPADPIFVDIEDPANLESLFYKLDVLKYALIVECKEIDHLITVLQKERAEKEAEYAPEIEEVEKKIMAEILKHGESFKCSYGSAAFRKAYERASWDDKKLQGFAILHPEILECRKVSVVEASVQIKVGGKK
ncbi:hypothetical protein MSHOH_1478 [Methanosarcina horonobensis HB-1 = JCM 15518]|uniref:Uncharacterized protein n=1 Tax=Methanosarcina horonobensis HB-1 = JCM 15518 TaxID=1434110 RepID=A0A0E3SAY0_9EURY|nr:hypothetical protein [Methanosarcina horonobensis]AKB77961.1 hypothetical protein MSHOH_1478 [Methanosarcina horonobensis HB-1 = JCM 15518]